MEPLVPQNSNRITQERIDALLAASSWSDTKVGVKTTVVCCTLPNGFEVIESSGCVDPANYDHDLGVRICKKRIVDKIWMLEGYALAERNCQTVKFLYTHRMSEAVARVCHEANRSYCVALGDMSQVPWEMAPDWQRASAIKGVELHLANPSAGPQASHESWMAEKVATGWVYGPVKDTAAKTHPCMVPFDQLPREQQAKDYIFRAIVHALR